MKNIFAVIAIVLFGLCCYLTICYSQENEYEKNIQMLKDARPISRWTAASNLGSIGDLRAVNFLIAALRDENRNVRCSAADALGQLKSTRAVKPLIATLKDKDRVVRRSAAQALGKIKDTRIVKPLIAALKDEDPPVRYTAAIALGDIKSPQSIEPLITALKDKDSDVRLYVASSLRKIKDPRIIEPLKLYAKYRESDDEATKIYSSDNNSYTLYIYGLEGDEGIYHMDKISLKNKRGKVLWTKKSPTGSPPAVSNRGITAFANSNIIFIDRSGKELGSYEINYADENYLMYCADCLPVQYFSPDGNTYYTLIDSQKVPYILALTNCGELKWKFKFKNNLCYYCGEALPSILPFGGGLLAYYAVRDTDWNHESYILNDSGTVVTSYRNDIDARPIIDESKNTFSVRDEDSLRIYDIRTGKYLGVSNNDR